MSWPYRVTQLVARALVGTGLLALGYVAYVVIDTQAYQAIERRRFEDATEPVSGARRR
jgi:NADH:ubiquinone oxidoreductase subunit 3 (subunit A)